MRHDRSSPNLDHRSAALRAARAVVLLVLPAVALGVLWYQMGLWYQHRLLTREKQRVQVAADQYADMVEYAIDSALGQARALALGDRSPEYWDTSWIEPPRLSVGGTTVFVRIRVNNRLTDSFEVASHVSLDAIVQSAGLTHADPSIKYLLTDSTGTKVYGCDLAGQDPVMAMVRFPGSFWHLSAAPANGWHGAIRQDLWLLQGSMGLFFAAILAALHVSIRRHRLLAQSAETGRAALRLSEAGFRHLFDSVPDPLLVVTLSGVVVAANNTARDDLDLATPPATLDGVLTANGARDASIAQSLLEPGQSLCIETHQSGGQDLGKRFYETTTTSFQGGDGHDRLLIVFRDVTEATQAAQALRASEARYRELVEISPEGVLLLDIEGNMVVANRQAATICGYDAPELLLRSTHRFGDLVTPSQRAMASDSLLAALKGEPVRNLMLDIVQRSGARVPAEASIATLMGNQGTTGFVVALADITQRERVRRRNLAYRDRLRLLARSLSALLDLGDSDHALQVVAQGFCDLAGAKAAYLDRYDSEARLLTPCAFAGDSSVDRAMVSLAGGQLLGSSFPVSDDWHRRLASRGIQEQLGLTGASLGLVPFEQAETSLREMGASAIWGVALTRQGTAVGRAVLVMGHNHPTHFPEIVEAYAHAVTDLLQQRQAAQALRESEERYRSLMTNLGDALVILDSDLTVVEFRDTSTHTLALDPAQVVGAEYEVAFMSLASQGLVPTLLRGAMGTMRRVYRRATLDWLAPNGRTHRLDAAVFGFRYRGAPHAAMLLRDVTEREELIEQLHEHQRLEDLGRFAAGAAHDLSKILALLKAEMELIGDAIPRDPDGALDLLAALDRAVLLGEIFTTTLVEYGQDRKPMLGPLHMNLVLEGRSALMRELLGSGIDLTLRLSPAMILCLADAAMFERAWLNLLVNAREAMKDGGRLTVSTRQEMLDASNATELGLLPGDYAVISFSDTGHGMTPEQIERIFDPFYSSRQNSLQAGLGLAIVKRVMDGHNGATIVQSDHGIGTTFELWFPAISAADIAESTEDLGLAQTE